MYQAKVIARDIRLGIKNLLLHKLRSTLTMLGVVFGVGSVIAMLAVGEGASEEALEQIRKLGSNNIIINSIKPVDEAGGQRRTIMSAYGILYKDRDRIDETIPWVKRTVPAKIVRKTGRLKDRVLELRLVGTTPEWANVVRRKIIAGRGLVKADLEKQRNVCILTEHGARRILATEETIGKTIRVGGKCFEVMGIVRSESDQAGSINTPDREIDAYIPLTVCKSFFGDAVWESSSGQRTFEYVELHMLLVEAEDIDSVPAVAESLETMFKRFHTKDDFRINVPLVLLRQAEATKRTFNIVLGSIAAISLLVGGIGIMNIMLASVTERIREIGIRRAIGAKKRQIVLQFLIETVVLSTVGGAIGIGIGLFIPWLITRFAGMPTTVTGTSLVLSLGISLGIGIVFGLYPAVRAANLDPIVALRHE